MSRSGVRLLIVDALNLIRRVDAARRDHAAGRSPEACVNACTQSLRRALHEGGPSHAVCVFEGEGKCFRTEIYPEYKAGRQPMPADLEENLPAIREAFLQTGVPSIGFEGMEADDIVATLASKVGSANGEAIILSTDKTFLQLLSDRIRVRDHFARKDLDEAYVYEKFGVPSSLLADLLAMAGDPTNNIPGIPSVGRKTAARLLDEHGTLENVLSHASLIGGAAGRAIEEHAQDALLFRTLLRLRTDIDLGLNLRSFRFRG